MGVLGEMFPGPKIRDEAAEAGDGEQPWRLGPIDLDNNTVVVHRDATAPSVSPHVGSAVPFDDGGDVDRGRAQQG